MSNNFLHKLKKIQLSDIDAPAFTHSVRFKEHFDYIKETFVQMLTDTPENNNNQQSENYPGKAYQPLFDHLFNEHGLILTESEMNDIVHLVNPQAQPGPVWMKASEFKYEVGRVYHAGDWDSKGAGFFNKAGCFLWCDGSLTNPIDQDKVYILDESCATDWKVKYDELQKEVEHLRRWKIEAAELLAKIYAYAHKNMEVGLGECIVSSVIDRCKKGDKMLATLEIIAKQMTCQEQQDDPEAEEDENGSKLGDIEYAYDHVINDAREAIAWKGEKETVVIGHITYCHPCGFPVDECNCPGIEKEGENEM